MEDNVKVLQVDTSQAQSNVDKLAKSVNEVSNKINTGFATAGKGMETFSQAAGKASMSTQTLQKSLGGMGGSLKGLQDMMPFLQSGLGGAASGMAALTKQALAFIATPIGAVIAAIGFAVKQLIDAFKRNEEAMASLKKLMAPFQALWQSIQRVFDDVVKSLVGVMDKLNGANGSTNILSKSLKGLEVVIGIIKGSFKVLERNISAVFTVINKLGTAAKNFVDKTPIKGFLQDLGDAFEKVRGAVVKFVNTVANSKFGKLLGWDIITDEIKSAVQETDELTKSNQKIVDLQTKINKLEEENVKKIAENDSKISELREKAADKEQYSAEQRKKFLEEANKIDQDNLKRETELAQAKLDLIKEQNSLTESNTEDRQKEAKAQAELDNINKKYTDRQKERTSQIIAINKEAAAAAQQKAKDEAAATKATEEATKAKTEADLKASQEALDKRLEQNKRLEQSDEERLKKEIEIENERLALYDKSSLEWEKQQTKIADLKKQLTNLQNEERDELQKSYDDYLKNNEDSNLTYLEKLANAKTEEEAFLENLRDKGIIDEEEYQQHLTQISKKYGNLRAQEHLKNSLAVANGLADILNSIASMQDENDKEGFERSKNLQIGAATINMLAGITAALSGLFTTKSGPWDIALATIQAATIAASGIANIAKIKSTKFDGNSSSASASVPSASAIGATIMQPTQYTQAVQGAQLEDKIGDTKVYVTETDISNTMKKVSVQETENRY